VSSAPTVQAFGRRLPLPLPATGQRCRSTMWLMSTPACSREWELSTEQLEHRGKGLALPGSYRRLLQRPLHMSWAIVLVRWPDNDPRAHRPRPAARAARLHRRARRRYRRAPQVPATAVDLCDCLRELTKHSPSTQQRSSTSSPSTSAASSLREVEGREVKQQRRRRRRGHRPQGGELRCER